MLNAQVQVTNNSIIKEKIATARIVNQQNMSFDDFCTYIAEGSTVTAADVSAVMKRIETLLPMLLSLNTKINASPAGLIFRTGIKGSLTQSQLKERLLAKRAEMIANGDSAGAAKVDVTRTITASDLAVSELTETAEEENYYLRERKACSGERTITLPAKATAEGAKATFKNGIMELILPKCAPEEGIRIEIE